MRKLLLATLFISIGLQAQHTISGSIESEQELKWILLYQMEGSKQEYISNASVIDGQFNMTIPESAPTGVYRLIYTMNSYPYLDIIYNKEDIALHFDAKHPTETVVFTKSEDNQLVHDYLATVGATQHLIDSAQIAYFSADHKQRKELADIYETNYEKQQKAQTTYEELSKDKLAYHFIKASKRYNASSPFEVPEKYLHDVKTHFFDAIDFDNEILQNSTLINDKVNDFIFYVNHSDDPVMNAKLQKVAVATAIGKFENNNKLAKDIEEGLIYTFLNNQNPDMAQYVLDNHYEKLPFNYQDANFIKDIEGQLRTALGKQVPNFTWEESGSKKALNDLSGKDYYVVAFWSSTCGHCLKEMPVLYDFMKDKANIQVIAFGLEDQMSTSKWRAQITKYPNFTNVLGSGKWENPTAREYGINATPTFLILDADKKVLAKPDDVEALKSFFNKF